MPVVMGPRDDNRLRLAFARLILAASARKIALLRRITNWLCISCIVAVLITLVLGAEVMPSPVKPNLCLVALVALSVLCLSAWVALVILLSKRLAIVRPVQRIFTENPELAQTSTITAYKIQGQKKMLLTTAEGDGWLYNLAFNPIDTTLVKCAFEIAGKKSPEIVNNMG